MVRKREMKKNKRKKITTVKKHHNDVDDSDMEINDMDNFDTEDGILDEDIVEEVAKVKPRPKLAEKTKERLKTKITDWLDSDDKIKNLNKRVKKYKDSKKEQEDIIIKMIVKLGMEEKKIDVHDDNDALRSRVYRHKSVTRGAIKEDIVKAGLMEAIRDEKKVDQLVKK